MFFFFVPFHLMKGVLVMSEKDPIRGPRTLNTIEVGVVRPDWRRWLVLGMYMLYVLGSQTQYAGFVTIVPKISRLVNVNHSAVDSLTSIYSIAFVVVVIPICVFFEKWGLKRGVVLGAFLNACSGGIRLACATLLPQYWVLFVAAVLSGVGTAFSLGSAPLVASTWFPANERSVATAMGTLPGFMGFALAASSSVNIVDSADPDPSGEGVQTKGIAVLFVFQTLLSAIPAIGLALLPKLPPYPPSHTASGRKKGDVLFSHACLDLMKSLKICFSDANFSILIVTFGSVVGLFTAFATLLAQVFVPMGVSTKQTSWIVFTAVLAGAVSTFAVGPVLDRLKQYKKCWLSIVGAQLLVMVVTSSVLSTNVFYDGMSASGGILAGLYVFYVLNEAIMLPQYAVVMELAVELIYPQPAEVAGNACMLSMSVWNFVGVQGMSHLLGNSPGMGTVRVLFWSLTMCLVGVLAIASIALKEELRRQSAEKVAEQVAVE